MLKGKRTYILGLAVMLLGQMQSDPNFSALLGQYAGIATSVIGIAIMVLRSVTNTSPLAGTSNTASK